MSHASLLSPDRPQVLNLAEHATVSAAGIVSRTLLQTPELRVVLFAFDAGQELTAHTSRRRAVLQVVGGTGEFSFNGSTQRLEAGALLHLPPHAPHAVRAGAGPFTMLLILASEPSASSSS